MLVAIEEKGKERLFLDIVSWDTVEEEIIDAFYWKEVGFYNANHDPNEIPLRGYFFVENPSCKCIRRVSERVNIIPVKEE